MDLTTRREFHRLITGYALSTAGDAGVRMVLAWIALESHGTDAMSGVFLGSAAACVFGPLVGRLLDRHSVRGILSATCVARFALMLTLVFINPQTTARHAAIYAFLAAFFSLAYGPAVSKTIPAMFDPETMHEANATSGVAFLIASAAGPALGGAILARYGLGAACAVFAALFLVNALFAHLVTFPLARSGAGVRHSNSFTDVLRSLARMPDVLILALLGIALNFALAPINVALAPLMLQLGAGPRGFGLAMAVFMAGALVGNVIAGGRFLRTTNWERSVLASLGAVAFSLVAVGVSQSHSQVMLSIFLIGAFLPFFQVPVSTRLQRLVPAASAGQVFAALNSMTLLSAPLAAATVGLLLKRLAPAQVFMGAAALSGVLCVCWMFLRREEAPAKASLNGKIGQA